MRKSVFVLFASVLLAGIVRGAGFADFDRRAQAGEDLTVVFFGGSLTWSANASDPNVTGFRGLMADYFRRTYPRTRFAFVDAAIGGTGSNLGIFRLERDVLSKKPDLVFLDFICNDGGDNRDILNTCCYEYLLRRMIGAGIPVVQMFFTFKGWVEAGAPYERQHPRLVDYRRLAAAYATGVGDVYSDGLVPRLDALQGKARAEMIERIWPIDGGHPGDFGYGLFAAAGIAGYERAVRGGLVCRVPEKPVFGTVEDVRRLNAADLSLPEGWVRKLTFRTSAWYDGLSSRWMDDVAVTGSKNALKVSARANLVGFFGEGDDRSPKAVLNVDGGRVSEFDFSPHIGAPLFVWRMKTLEGWQTDRGRVRSLEIVPTGDGELRLGAVCTAVVVPSVRTADTGCDGSAALERIDHARGGK